MSLPNPTEQQLMVLQKHLPDDIAQHATIRQAYALAVDLSGEHNALRWLIVTTTLGEVLHTDTDLLAIALLHHCALTQGDALLARLPDTPLADLKDGLAFFLPVPADPDRFLSAAERWQRETANWQAAPEALQAIRLANYVEQLRRRNWHNFLQRQQLLERASLLLEAIPEGSLAHGWAKELGSVVKEIQGRSEPRNSALDRVAQAQ